MKYLVIILLTVFSITAKSQIIYTPLSAGGYQMKYAKVDSGFALPVRDTSIGRGVDRPGLLTVQPTDSLIYYYTGKYWKLLRADSSANVTGKVDSITVSGNTVFYWTGGVGYGNPLPDIQVIQNTVDSSDVGFQDLAGSVHHLVILAPDGGSTGVSGGIQSIQAGTGITVDNTNISNPIVSTSKPIRPYKVYTAILFDTATAGAPTLIPLENTLGCTVSISYTGVGWYTVTLSQPLMTNYSTVVYCQNQAYSPMALLEYDQSDVSHFYLHVRLTDGTPVDNQCNGAMVEIRIY